MGVHYAAIAAHGTGRADEATDQRRHGPIIGFGDLCFSPPSSAGGRCVDRGAHRRCDDEHCDANSRGRHERRGTKRGYDDFIGLTVSYDNAWFLLTDGSELVYFALVGPAGCEHTFAPNFSLHSAHSRIRLGFQLHEKPCPQRARQDHYTR